MNALREAEQAILAEGREWTRLRLEQRMQQESEAIEALCPKTGWPLKDTRWRDMNLHTVSGIIHLRVRHGYSEALQQWVCPARIAWGLEERQRVSPELQARVGYTSVETGSYERASAMAKCWGTEVSDDLIHHHVQRCGAAAAAIELPAPPTLEHEPEFSVVIMMDGWMARERGPDWGASPRKKAPERIAWHEIKSAVIYRLEQRAEKESGRGLLVEKNIVACPPETTPVDFGVAVEAEAVLEAGAAAALDGDTKHRDSGFFRHQRADLVRRRRRQRHDLLGALLDFHRIRIVATTMAAALFPAGPGDPTL